ncbi:MAG: bifunctional phosphopantothenoylcysteine decarboxylase/phosphopantothenate--cysteine ligase CoaBC [Myxococcales bacterium]|nr:MAG: bifunctional phosphopantothenoylcysteine decarboxylase/phosphopantothenate--cysteine ligase CoaBC [Myxococcales bacterium]
MLKGKRVLLGVTGGIAAYRAAELARMLTREGAEVRVAMTAAACEFVQPLTFQALCGHPVMLSLFDQQEESQIGHIAAARWPDCIVVAPATANFIGKAAGGIADDLLTTIVMASRKPVVLAPAMNWAMWQNEFVQANLARLTALERFQIVPPEEGEMACGETGKGRLATLDFIIDRVVYASREEKDLHDETVLITSGPTYEDIDPVRFVANRSSGKMGFALAREARARGGRVILIAGPNSLIPPCDVQVVPVRTAAQMLEAVRKHAPEANVIIKAAAVADFRPARTADRKIHKDEGDFSLPLVKTVDILSELGQSKRHNQFLVGFAAETHQVMTYGSQKLREKRLDLIVVNDVSEEGAGFEVDTNVVKVIDNAGHIEQWPMMPKAKVAVMLFDLIQKHRANQKGPDKGRDGHSVRPSHRPGGGRRRRSKRGGGGGGGGGGESRGGEGRANGGNPEGQPA